MGDNALHLPGIVELLGLLGIGGPGRQAKMQDTQMQEKTKQMGIQTQQAQAMLNQFLAMDPQQRELLMQEVQKARTANEFMPREREAGLQNTMSQTGLNQAQSQHVNATTEGQQLQNAWYPQMQQDQLANSASTRGLQSMQTQMMPQELALRNRQLAGENEYRQGLLQQGMTDSAYMYPYFMVPGQQQPVMNPDFLKRVPMPQQQGRYTPEHKQAFLDAFLRGGQPPQAQAKSQEPSGAPYTQATPGNPRTMMARSINAPRGPLGQEPPNAGQTMPTGRSGSGTSPVPQSQPATGGWFTPYPGQGLGAQQFTNGFNRKRQTMFDNARGGQPLNP